MEGGDGRGSSMRGAGSLERQRGGVIAGGTSGRGGRDGCDGRAGVTGGRRGRKVAACGAAGGMGVRPRERASMGVQVPAVLHGHEF